MTTLDHFDSAPRSRARRLLGCGFKLLLAVAVVVGLGVLWVMARSGQFRELVPLEAGECRRYEGAPGAEDLEVERATGTLVISSDDRRARGGGAPGEATGGLYVLDLKDPQGQIEELAHDFAAPLRPHGISLVEAGGNGALFVVNHADGHSIEVFRLASKAATHLRTVRHELLISPNDVAGVDDRRFYATNDHGAGGPLRQRIDDWLGLRRSSVVYWDGESMRTVASGLGYANGIALNPEGKYLYVAATSEGKIYVFARDEASGDLALVKTLDIDTGVDNLEVDLYGGIWVAGHPHLLSFLRHAADPAVRSPSQVFWVDPAEDMEPPIRPVWVNDGEALSGASVAVPFGARFAVGSVFEPHILVCARS